MAYENRDKLPLRTGDNTQVLPPRKLDSISIVVMYSNTQSSPVDGLCRLKKD
jgi:hypothetical protein